MPRDLRNILSPVFTLNPGTRTANGTGTTVDRQGFDGVYAIAMFGVYTDGTFTPSLQESNDGSTWVACATADLQGSFAPVSSAGGANTMQQVGYIGSARYIRILMTVSGATTGASCSAIIIRGYASQQPVT